MIGIGLLTALTLRDRLGVNVQHDRNPIFVQMSDGAIRNGYTVKILNMVQEPRVITLSLDGLPGATMAIGGLDEPDGVSFSVPVEPDKLRALRVFVRQPAADVVPGSTQFQLIVEDRQSNEMDVYDAVFEAPEGK
jgi:polyferredoxin